MHFTDQPVTLNSHYCAFENYYSDVFIHCPDLAIIVITYWCSSKFHSILFVHFTDLALFLKSDYWAFELPMHWMVLLLIINSNHRLFKLDSSLLMYSSDLEPFLHHHFFKFGLLFFCFYALHRPSSHSQQSILRIWVLLFSCILQILLLLSTVIIAHSSSILLFLCISQVCLSLSSTVIIVHLRTSVVMFLLITQTLLSLPAVINADSSSILLFLSIL